MMVSGDELLISEQRMRGKILRIAAILFRAPGIGSVESELWDVLRHCYAGCPTCISCNGIARLHSPVYVWHSWIIVRNPSVPSSEADQYQTTFRKMQNISADFRWNFQSTEWMQTSSHRYDEQRVSRRVTQTLIQIWLIISAKLYYDRCKQGCPATETNLTQLLHSNC